MKSKHKTFTQALFLVSLILFLGANIHAEDTGSPLVVLDIGVSNQRDLPTIQAGHDNIQIYFRIANCGTQVMEDLRVEVIPLNSTTKMHPSSPPFRRIALLDPGKYEDVLCRVDAFSSGPLVELAVVAWDGYHTYLGHFTFVRDTAYQHVDRMGGNCEKALKPLKVFPDLSRDEILAEARDMSRQEKTVLLRDTGADAMPGRRVSREPRPPHRTAKRLYALGALTGLGTGTYFLLEANKLFENDYKEATFDAPDIRNKIERYDMIWQAAFALSAPLIVMAGIKAVQQNRAGNSFQLGAAPTGGGAVVGVRFDF